MNFVEIVKIAAAILTSLGGGGAIVLGLSAWLGKLWANRLMEGERQRYAIELARVSESLRHSTEAELKSLDAQFEIRKKEHLDRVTIYRGTIDLLASILGNVVMINAGRRKAFTPEEAVTFETQRLRVYAYLAMHAPQSVMDAHDSIVDLLLDVVVDGKETSWLEIRNRALHFLNEVRKDIGISHEPISYRGEVVLVVWTKKQQFLDGAAGC